MSACTSGKPKQSFDPAPRPNRPGEAVVIAGAPNLNGTPHDGEYALQASATSNGGLAVGPDGSIYFPARYLATYQLARITPDGRLHLLPVYSASDQITISGANLWMLSSRSQGLRLEKIALSNFQKEIWLDEKPPMLVDAHQRPLSRKESNDLLSPTGWGDAKLTMRADGTPVVVSARGELFEALGHNKLRPWSAPGHSSAVKSLRRETNFKVADVSDDGKGNLAILGNSGVLRIPSTGAATAVLFPQRVLQRPSRWAAALALANGSVVLLGTQDTQPDDLPPAMVTPDGRLDTLSWGPSTHCGPTDDSLAMIRSASPGKIVRHPSGAYVITDLGCGRIYMFRLPEKLG
ncbi:hypothetical protein [Actinomadura macrotermitis]|uniref:Uncharacterized protein n=1 Tax=Actinomadura macrotermitis TaxID=2585200 RepID=A0A7K0BST3_9ACTN|nr:hypothetical protein [Actinomadura macrotermitis]MQY04096.1 hypothetical protein [Actinomadura macrotermitis]